MPTTRKLKPRTQPRSTGRGKERAKAAGSSAPTKRTRTQEDVVAELLNVQDGEIVISWSEAETVPVGPYANVVIVPVTAFRKIKDPGGTSDEDKKAIKAQLTFLKDVIEEIVSEDRWQIEQAVARYNEKEDEGKNGSK